MIGLSVVANGIMLSFMTAFMELFGNSAWWFRMILGMLALISIGAAFSFWKSVISQKQLAAEDSRSRLTQYYSASDWDVRIR